MKTIYSTSQVEQKIFLIHGQRVMLDADLAELYGVQVKVLIQAVKRNIERFPFDFMFQLSWDEAKKLKSQIQAYDMRESSRSQIVTLKRGFNIKYRPYAFTEQGVAMLSSVLRGKRAVQVNIAIMRAFVRLRELLSTNKDMARRMDELEKKYDSQFRVVFEAIKEMMESPEPPKKQIGFTAKERRARYALKR